MMNIEIRGTNFLNKGAELMLLTILKMLKDENYNFVISPHFKNIKYEDYSKLNLYPKLSIELKSRQWVFFDKIFPKFIRDMYGLILNSEIDVILDASGFAYGDQQGIAAIKFMANNTIKWKKENKKVILLPQAFGPFENNNIKKNMQIIIENSDLIFAREIESYSNLIKISDERFKNKIKLSPDFTMLIDGTLPSYYQNIKNKICIVPNKRMIDKLDNKHAEENYIKLISYIVEQCFKFGFEPFFLIHGGAEDKLIAEKINKQINRNILIIDENNALYIKGIIGYSKGLISSRYHGLASGLYQGIPTLGTSWSHKYQMLFDDYGFSDGLLDVNMKEKEIDERLHYLFNTDSSLKLSKKLLKIKDNQKGLSIKMFKTIIKELNNNGPIQE